MTPTFPKKNRQVNRANIAFSTGVYYDRPMKTLTIRIDAKLHRWLAGEAKRLGCTKSELVRNTLIQLSEKKRPSLHDRMKGVCGVINGPRDLSESMDKYLEGFGESS